MTASGAGALASIALRSPWTLRRFSRSRGGGAHFGLTPREHSSDELIYQGRISKRRDPEAPALLLAG
jgi:transposase